MKLSEQLIEGDALWVSVWFHSLYSVTLVLFSSYDTNPCLSKVDGFRKYSWDRNKVLLKAI